MDEKQILKETIKDAQKVLDEANTKLEALKKPKLKHGDYGYNTRGSYFVLLSIESGPLQPFDLSAIYANGETDGSCYVDYPGNEYTILGNIFEDLKRNSEDLTEFEQMDCDGDVANFSVNEDEIYIDFIKCSQRFCLPEAEEFYQKFGQMLATLKRSFKIK